jgi:hypothetical protein
VQIDSLKRRPRRGVLAAMLAAASVALVAVSLVSPSAAQEEPLDPDEISHSANVQHVANIPRQGANATFTHSDIAFWRNTAIQGTYGGLNFYDIEDPTDPQIISQVSCPGSQGDPTVSEDGSLVFMSVDAPRSDDSCASTGSNAANPNAWEGIRIFDISNVSNPRYVKSVRTDCGSHTHTLVPDDSGEVVYLYVSSYFPNAAFPNCQPPHDSISIIKVPLDDPTSASVIAKPNLFPEGGAPGTSGCHDITVFPEEDLAAGACMGEGVLMDISDPANPHVITSVQDPNFAFWHSATFTNDADGVIFTDELGGGVGATCNEQVGPDHGADAIFDIVGEGDARQLVFRSYFKIPRHQQSTENCVAHNGSLIPVRGRDIMVQSWYQGGVSVWEFTDPENPVEIGYFERGPLSPPGLGGSWSAYWYNGYIYSSDIAKGLDVLRVKGDVSGANQVRQRMFNAQTQYSLHVGMN